MKTKAFLHACLLFVLFSGSFAFPTVASGVSGNPTQAAPSSDTLYVKPDGAGDCSDWEHACDLVMALGLAVSPAEIWVAEGVYYPGTGDDLTQSFHLGGEVSLYGGFIGTEATREGRLWQDHKSILSGDLDRNDDNTDGLLNHWTDISGSNAYHVIVDDSSAATSELDGFYITGGSGEHPAIHLPQDRGGGIYMLNSQRRLRNIVFQGNQANGGGGLFVDGGEPELVDVTFKKNRAFLNGGGMHTYNGSNTILTNATFEQNTATNGGGMLNGSSTQVMTNTLFLTNTAIYSGGGMYNNDSSVTMNDFTFSGNSAGPDINHDPLELGGGMANDNSSLLTLIHGRFDGNQNQYGQGGGLYIIRGNTSTITDVQFTNNTAVQGGGMYIDDADSRLTDVIFWHNWAFVKGDQPLMGLGGGLHSEENSRLTNVSFIGNTADHWGGGMYSGGSPILTNVNFISNRVICVNQYVDCDGLKGGGLFTQVGTARLTNATFYNNWVDGEGGGMYNSFCQPIVKNSIFWENKPEQINILFIPPDVTYSDVQGGWFGTHNKNVDPRFVDRGSGNLRLLGSSPLIDAGNTDALPADVLDLDEDGETSEPLPFDLDGNPRLVDAPGSANTGKSSGGYPFVDIGAYEFQGSTIIYVDQDAPGSAHDGASWATAYTNLASGLFAAASGDEIWMAEGEYTPSKRTDPDDPRSATFQLVNGVGVYGGFDGAESFRDQRDPAAHLTTLSGDLNGDGIINDDAYHVVATGGVTQTAILDGFTITMGRAGTLEGYREHGGGILNLNGSPTLANLHITYNRAFGGGGMYSEGASSRPVLSNITFSQNYARDYGGGLYTYASSPWLTNVTFTANTTDLYGGGLIARSSSSPELLNVTIFGNNAASQGGGIFAGAGSSATLTNAIVWGNTTTSGSDPQVTGVISATFSDIQDEYTGVVDADGNFSLDPLLEDLGDHGGFTPTHALGEGSPAVDAGSPAVCPDTDQRGVPRPMDGDQDRVAICDMGAYEVPFYWLFLPLTIK